MADLFSARVDPRPTDSPWPPLRWPVPPDTVLDGRVVSLRPASPAIDAPELFAALDDDALWRHVAGRPGSPREFAELLTARYESGILPWVVRLRTEYRGYPAGTVVGTSSYLDVDPAGARLEIGSTTYIAPMWATMVNPDTKLALLRFAFETLGAGRVQLKTDIRNTRSQQAIARLGAHYEGTLRRYQRRSDDTIRDTVIFSIITEEWPEVRTGLETRLS